MRIWYQSMTGLRTLTSYAETLAAHARRIVPDVEVAFGGVTEARYDGRVPAESALRLRETRVGPRPSTSAAAPRPPASTWSRWHAPPKRCLREIRSLLDIPGGVDAGVALDTSPARSANRWDWSRWRRRNSCASRRWPRHGLESRVTTHPPARRASRRGRSPSRDSANCSQRSFFLATARRGSRSGRRRDRSIRGHPEPDRARQRREDGRFASAQDGVGAALLYADGAVPLRRRAGVGVARRGTYAKPPHVRRCSMRRGREGRRAPRRSPALERRRHRLDHAQLSRWR